MFRHIFWRLAQSSFFAVSFEPLEYKNLGPLDFVPFAVDAHRNLRAGGYGMVEKVFEDDKPLARKTISDNYDLAKDDDENQNLGPGHWHRKSSSCPPSMCLQTRKSRLPRDVSLVRIRFKRFSQKRS
jgi:hypothetical protein